MPAEVSCRHAARDAHAGLGGPGILAHRTDTHPPCTQGAPSLRGAHRAETEAIVKGPSEIHGCCGKPCASDRSNLPDPASFLGPDQIATFCSSVLGPETDDPCTDAKAPRLRAMRPRLQGRAPHRRPWADEAGDSAARHRPARPLSRNRATDCDMQRASCRRRVTPVYIEAMTCHPNRNPSCAPRAGAAMPRVACRPLNRRDDSAGLRPELAAHP